jgi:hypothetical protein
MKIAGFERAMRKTRKSAAYLKMSKTTLERHPTCHVVLLQGFADHFYASSAFQSMTRLWEIALQSSRMDT